MITNCLEKIDGYLLEKGSVLYNKNTYTLAGIKESLKTLSELDIEHPDIEGINARVRKIEERLEKSGSYYRSRA